jgi:hypothetical protein
LYFNGGRNLPFVTDTTILLGIEDVTESLALEREKDDLLKQKGVLLKEIVLRFRLIVNTRSVCTASSIRRRMIG